MTKSQAKKRIEKLKLSINRHRYLYHVLDKEEISDAALDSLKHELLKLENQFSEFLTPDSPTQRVAGEPLKSFKKVQHTLPMLSIEDIFSDQELEDWEQYIKRLEPRAKLEYFAELKIDGFAITLFYENGVFVKGATRGNGLVGEDVTQNLKTIESVPLKIDIHAKMRGKLAKFQKPLENLLKTGTVEVRGEVYMEKKDFEKLNVELIKKGLKPYANPRNLAAGSIRQLDSKLAASRPLKFLAYNLVADIGQSKHSEDHLILPCLGFKTDPGKVCKDIGDVVEFWKEVSLKREKLPFLIDGVVVSINDDALFNKLGVAGKSPRGIRAFKFSPKQATTKIKDIVIQVGRTGALTPIAHLEPVQVGGVMITRATLHNEDEISRLEVKIGDTVIIERAGDVIPAVNSVLKELRSGNEKAFHFPKGCPVCGFKVVRREKEAIWRCPNRDCQARKREQLYHMTSKKGFDIKGLGPQIINRLADEGIITGAVDIFRLKEGDIVPLERFAEKSAKNIVASIEKSKEIPLAKFIYSLGIFHVGEETAIDLANCFGSIENVRKAGKEDLDRIPNIGPEVSNSLLEWFERKSNQQMIDDLLSEGVKILKPEKMKNTLKGKSFVLTGGLATMTRDEAKKKIRILGGEVSESVSSETDYLIAGFDPGSKFDKAKKIGVKIINEKEFIRLIT